MKAFTKVVSVLARGDSNSSKADSLVWPPVHGERIETPITWIFYSQTSAYSWDSWLFCSVSASVTRLLPSNWLEVAGLSLVIHSGLSHLPGFLAGKLTYDKGTRSNKLNCFSSCQMLFKDLWIWPSHIFFLFPFHTSTNSPLAPCWLPEISVHGSPSTDSLSMWNIL